MNELGHEIAEAAGPERAPVLGSGHPLADIMLLKHRPQTSELHEGVAFFGRAGPGGAEVDPAPARGSDGDLRDELLQVRGRSPTTRRTRFLTRELHIVQPKLVVVMGQDSLACLNALHFPLATELQGEQGTIQQLTPTVEALLVPDIDTALDEQDGEEGLLGRHSRQSAPGGPICRRTSALDRARRLVGDRAAPLGDTPATGATWPSWRSAVAPALFAMVWLALPARRCARSGAGSASSRSGSCWPRSSSRSPNLEHAAELLQVRRRDVDRLVVPDVLRGALVGAARRADHHPRGSLLGRAGADEGDHGEPARGVRRAVGLHADPRARTRRRRRCAAARASRTSSSSPCSSARARGSRSASNPPGSRWCSRSARRSRPPSSSTRPAWPRCRSCRSRSSS